MFIFGALEGEGAKQDSFHACLVLLQWFQAKGGLPGPLYKRHLWVCAIYSEILLLLI